MLWYNLHSTREYNAIQVYEANATCVVAGHRRYVQLQPDAFWTTMIEQEHTQRTLYEETAPL
jgi:hypothetical protein